MSVHSQYGTVKNNTEIVGNRRNLAHHKARPDHCQSPTQFSGYVWTLIV